MATHSYHKVLPTSNNQNGYIEHDQLDFLITASQDRALIPDSILLEYSLEVFKTGSTLVTNAIEDEICLTSAHAIFDNFQCETESNGMVENLANYNRYCYMTEKMTKSKTDLFNSVDNAKGCNLTRANEFINCQQESTQLAGFVNKNDPHYCIKPKICFNRSVGGQYMFSNGYIKLSTTLARINKALYGRYSGSTDMTYKIKNVNVRYETQPAELASNAPMMAFSYKGIKSVVSSQNNNIQAIVPSKACSGVMCSFISQDDDNNFKVNSSQMQLLHGIDGLRFLYNSQLGQRVAYNIQDIREMLCSSRRGIKY